MESCAMPSTDRNIDESMHFLKIYIDFFRIQVVCFPHLNTWHLWDCASELLGAFFCGNAFTWNNHRG